MSTNRVGDGQRAEQRVADDRRQSRQAGAKQEEKRSFSQVMKQREMPSGESRGDERGRRLREGTVQKGARQERANHGEQQHLQRKHTSQRESARKEAPQENRREDRPIGAGKDGESREDSLRDDGQTKGMNAQAQESWRGSADAVQQVGSRAGGAGEAQQMEAYRAKNPAMEEVARQIVNAVRVGEDHQARRVMFLDVTVPGRGDVRIRLRQDGGGMEVRMRADNDALARTLQEGVGDLRRQGAQKGVQFTSIRVVR